MGACLAHTDSPYRPSRQGEVCAGRFDDGADTATR
jgi:hypothetical protein